MEGKCEQCGKIGRLEEFQKRKLCRMCAIDARLEFRRLVDAEEDSANELKSQVAEATNHVADEMAKINTQTTNAEIDDNNNPTELNKDTTHSVRYNHTLLGSAKLFDMAANSLLYIVYAIAGIVVLPIVFCIFAYMSFGTICFLAVVFILTASIFSKKFRNLMGNIVGGVVLSIVYIKYILIGLFVLYTLMAIYMGQAENAIAIWVVILLFKLVTSGSHDSDYGAGDIFDELDYQRHCERMNEVMQERNSIVYDANASREAKDRARERAREKLDALERKRKEMLHDMKKSEGDIDFYTPRPKEHDWR